MRRDHPGRHPRRLLAGLLLLALSAPGVAEGQPESPSETARDSVGILVDNQDRCLELSHGKLEILEADYDDDKQTEELEHYLENQSQTSVRVARNALGITRRLAESLESGSEDAVSRSVAGMLGSQEDLCDWATDPHSWNDAAIYRQQVRGQGERFAEDLSALPPELQLTDSQRREVIQKYRQQLYDSRDDLIEEGLAHTMAEDGEIDDSISVEEYERKKQEYAEWLAEQERREAGRIRLDAERRAANLERLKQQPREMPRLELEVPEEPKPAAVDPEAMVTWHGDYSSKITPFKRSLSGYLKARGPSRTLIMFNACLDLARAAENVLEDPTALAAPDPQVAKLLRVAVNHFKMAADACVNNRLKTTRASIAEGERALGQAVKALKPYGLGL